MLLWLASSEKQIPQVIVFIRNQEKQMELLEATPLRPKQVRYQAALHPDILTPLILGIFLNARERPWPVSVTKP